MLTSHRQNVAGRTRADLIQSMAGITRADLTQTKRTAGTTCADLTQRWPVQRVLTSHRRKVVGATGAVSVCCFRGCAQHAEAEDGTHLA